ncbi:CNH domain-containing protein [Salix suchowensis]|nr:CNH domain-containing protein [Salix suchowensis]
MFTETIKLYLLRPAFLRQLLRLLNTRGLILTTRSLVIRSRVNTPSDYYTYGDATTGPGVNRRPTDLLTDLANGQQSVYALEDEWSDSEDGDESRFITYSLLSNLAMQLRDKVPRVPRERKYPYPRAFTGKDIVSQLFFYEVEWGSRVLQDGVEDVYMFLDDVEGSSDAPPDRQELPTGVITILTTCYTTMCTGEGPCYAWSCPKRGKFTVDITVDEDVAPRSAETGWPENVPPEVIDALPPSEVNRQTIIHKLISKEVQYLQDLDTVDTLMLTIPTVFPQALRASNPPVIPRQDLEDFIDDVFSNILDLRECNRRLLDVMYVRQREQHPVIQRIGDILLDAATEFRLAYPEYVGHLPLAEKRLKDETESNAEFGCSLRYSPYGHCLALNLYNFLVAMRETSTPSSWRSHASRSQAIAQPTF